MEHEKSGAALAYIDRDDTNKTFAIAFATTPEDDTGVFHILEHSVLCGSDMYPVKEPFVDLLKGSLNTFLNAMTYNDKTVYPVCSQNERDFLNLVSVYMDAVLHPAAVKDERVFRQEGWHYEVSDEGELFYNGVVYNEMKGAYSQVDNLSAELIMSMLYPRSPYAKDSGGNPGFIPELTYEGFVAAHARYYHPENARIILDGTMNIDKVLSLLDSFLSKYDRSGAKTDVGIPEKPEAPVYKTAEYEISESDEEDGKARLILGWRTARYDEEEKNLAITLIRDSLMMSNEAPLKKALLDSGMCKDAIAYELSGIADNSFVLEVRDINKDDADKIERLVRSVIEQELAKGFDKDMLGASLELCEFKLREADSGSYPRGLVYALGTLDTWLYGGDPAAALSFSAVLAALREKLSTDYYERLAEELLISNQSRAALLMLPSKTLEARKSAELRERLASVKASLKDGELERIKDETAAFKAWQAREDSPEALASLPRLELSDISELPEKTPTEYSELDGSRLLYHPIGTGGIVYSQLAFDCSDLTGEELCLLTLMSGILTDVKTAGYDKLALKKKLRSAFGLFSVSCTPIATLTGGVFVSLDVKVHALERNKDEIAPMLKEILYTSDLSDKRAIKNAIAQTKLMFEEYFVAAGHLTALGRAGARSVLAISATEYTEGYNYYLFIKSCEKSFDDIADSLCEKMKALADKIFVKERLTLNISCERDGSLTAGIIGALKSGSGAGECKIELLPMENEGLIIPSGVSYAAQASNLYSHAKCYSGAMNVARMILNYEHLWHSIRVLGGAYGAGYILRQTGRSGFYTYRDPSPEKSLVAFSDSGRFLRKYINENTDLTKLIIGAVGALSPIVTPRSATETALIEFIAGTTYEDKCRIIREVIDTTPEDILKFAELLDELDKEACVCIVGGKAAIERCSARIDKVLEL